MAEVLNWELCLASQGYLARSGNLLIVIRWSGNTGSRGTSTIGRSRDMLLNSLQLIEEASQQTIIQSKMSVV